jgi:hypothetical protein
MFIGIDFSGSARPWKSKVSRPTVWIACVRVHSKPVLKDLLPVQALDEARCPPFERLVRLLAAAEFEACAIDAPFSLPTIHMPPGDHPELLHRVRELPNAIDRPFPLGSAIVSLGESICTKATAKPLRSTEKYWADRGVNTRSTMWSGPRGGASPFAAACLRLLERSERRVGRGRPSTVRHLFSRRPAATVGASLSAVRVSAAAQVSAAAAHRFGGIICAAQGCVSIGIDI